MNLYGNRTCQTTAIPTSCSSGTTEAESRQPSLGILIELAFGNIRKEFPVWSS